MSNQINPTITLAELYESQNQLMDAIDIYQKLQRISPSEAIREKLDYISGILLEQNHDQYNELTTLIFTKEEIEYFKIVSIFQSKVSTPTEEKSEMYDIENLDNVEFSEGNSVEKFFGTNENNEPAETDNRNPEPEINSNVEESSQENEKIFSHVEDTASTEKELNESIVKGYQIEHDVEKILHLDTEETSDESQDLTSEQGISKSDSVEKLLEERIPEEENLIYEKTENNLDESNPTMQEIMEIKQKLLKEKELLLQKASEIDNDRKLNKINLDKVKSKIARFENLNEEKRD